MGIILIILLILLIIGVLPRWNYSQNWGYTPIGVIVGIVIIVLVLMLLGIIPHWF